MTLSIGALRILRELLEGKTVAASRMKAPWAEMLTDEGALTVVAHGSRRSYKATSAEMLQAALASTFGITDINATLSLMTADNSTRAEAVAATGNSKARAVRTFCGFLVNSYDPIFAELNHQPITIAPSEGSYVFIADYAAFHIPPDVIVVGVENAENFRYIRQQRAFFKKEIAQDKPLLFVSRYPQNGDIVSWLKSVPNRYIHFGDLDLAGVSIYLTEYYAKLGDRASFLIPSDYRQRLLAGATERYDKQLPHYPLTKVADGRVKPLVDAIHAAHKGYDQEGYISLVSQGE